MAYFKVCSRCGEERYPPFYPDPKHLYGSICMECVGITFDEFREAEKEVIIDGYLNEYLHLDYEMEVFDVALKKKYGKTS